jgi:ABC-type multidrug transport system permease subunit
MLCRSIKWNVFHLHGTQHDYHRIFVDVFSIFKPRLSYSIIIFQDNMWIQTRDNRSPQMHLMSSTYFHWPGVLSICFLIFSFSAFFSSFILPCKVGFTLGVFLMLPFVSSEAWCHSWLTWNYSDIIIIIIIIIITLWIL